LTNRGCYASSSSSKSWNGLCLRGPF
jgi:hypothetical protein